METSEIVEGVIGCLRQIASPELASINEDDKLIDDLGLDSLDLLELVFLLEQRFKVRLSPRDLEKRAQAELGDRPIDLDGRYTPEAMVLIREALPEVPAAELPDDLPKQMLPRSFRVTTMMRLVERAMEEQQHA